MYSLPEKSPFTPSNEEKNINVVETLRKKILFQNIKNKQKLLKRGKK